MKEMKKQRSVYDDTRTTSILFHSASIILKLLKLLVKLYLFLCQVVSFPVYKRIM